MNKNLIVFCPGYSGLPPVRYNPLLTKFAEENFDVISINYKIFGRGDITDTAKRTTRVIAPLRDLYSHITLIGHSMGGLVARKALNILPTTADSLVTIGSPHKGTQAASGAIASLLGGRSVFQMKEGSKFLTNLGTPSVPTLTITGQWDILVEDGSMLGAKNITIPRGEHTLMLFSDRVFGEIYSWLIFDIMDETHNKGNKGTINEI